MKKDTFHLQREGTSRTPFPSRCAFACMQNMTPRSPEIRKEMEKLIQEALEINPNLVFDDCGKEWVDVCLDYLGLLDNLNIDAERQELLEVAREIYNRLKVVA